MMIRPTNLKYLFFQVVGLGIVLFLLIGSKYSKTSAYHYTWGGVVAQSNSYSCGASALSMIFIKHNINVPLSKIEDSIVKSWKGCSMLDLKNYAEINGVVANGWELSFEQLCKITMPAIVSVKGSHFFVIDSIKMDSVYFRDPLKGASSIPKDAFILQWDKNVLEFNLNSQN